MNLHVTRGWVLCGTEPEAEDRFLMDTGKHLRGCPEPCTQQDFSLSGLGEDGSQDIKFSLFVFLAGDTEDFRLNSLWKGYHLNLVSRFSFVRNANPLPEQNRDSRAPFRRSYHRNHHQCVCPRCWPDHQALCPDLPKTSADIRIYYFLSHQT